MSNTFDEVDMAIVQALLEDSRQSIRSIARHLGRAPGTITERVARLEALDVITGYSADVDTTNLGIGLQAVIALKIQQGPELQKVLDALMEIPELRAARIVTGQWDLLLDIDARDHFHLKEIVLTKIWGIPAFTHSETMIVYETRARPPARILAALRDHERRKASDDTSHTASSPDHV